MPGLEDTQEGDNGYVLLKRHEDRFAYLALRFIDEARWLETLHFPVDLGNYHYHLYDKTVDGMPRTGSLWEKMIGYGRLPDYQHKFLSKSYPPEWHELWKNHEEKEEGSKKPYMPPTMPHYHFPDENIAIKITETDEPAWPGIKPGDGSDKKAGKPATRQHPDLLLSKYDLFALVFYGLLLDTADKRKWEMEKKLRQYAEGRRQLYRNMASGKFEPVSSLLDVPKPSPNGEKDVRYDQRRIMLNEKLAKNGYRFTADELPDEIKCFLMGVRTETFEEKAKYRLRDLVVETEELQEKIKMQLREKRKPGSKKDVEVKAGILAGFLAKDIMRFQPADKSEGVKASGKPTSTLYNVLQAKLALYGANVDTLERTFNECGLMSGATEHPFLSPVVSRKPATIVDFYRAYLSARLKYLTDCQEEKNYHAWQWLKHNQARAKAQPGFGARLAAEMLKLPVVIPRGFFTDGIKKELLLLNNEKLTSAIENGRAANASYMAISYLRTLLDDKVQDFYDLPRVYKIFNNYHDKRTKANMRSMLAPAPLSEAERKQQMEGLKKWIKDTPKDEDYEKYKNRFDEFEANEKQIRQIKVQDITLFRMGDYLLKNINKGLIKTDGKFYLKDIAPKGEKGILDKPMENFGRNFHYSCTEKNKEQEATKGTMPLQKTEGTTRIFQEDLKVKNIGDFNKFIKDRRLNNLLAYINKKEIARPELEKELERYDTVRIEIFKILHDFEKAVLSKDPSIDGKDFNNIVEHFQKTGDVGGEKIIQIKKIRDAFSHNEYPAPQYFLTDEDIWSADTNEKYYADYFLKFIKSHLTTNQQIQSKIAPAATPAP